METKLLLEKRETIIHRENEFFISLLAEDKTFLICETKASYIPIEAFKDFFNGMTPLVKEHGIKKFIFDKLALRAFHQPTMEWYFLEWKMECLGYGLNVHQKILPQPAWFKKSVEAGRAKIRKENPDFPYEEFDIRYFDTIEDCIVF